MFGVGVIRGRIQTKLGQMSWTAMTLLYCMYFVNLVMCVTPVLLLQGLVCVNKKVNETMKRSSVRAHP